jgi:hypothetical protein
MDYFYLIIIICTIFSLLLSWPTIIDIHSADVSIQNKVLAFMLDKFHDFFVAFIFLLLIGATIEVFFTQNQFYLTLSIILTSIIILLNCKYHKCIITILYNQLLGKDYWTVYFDTTQKINCIYDGNCSIKLKEFNEDNFRKTYYIMIIYLLILAIVRVFL